MHARRSGFTLVEMLVAIGLLGLLGVIAWRGLDYVAGQRERIDRDAEETASILRVLAQLERDIAQRVPDIALPPAAAPGVLPASIAVTATDDGSASPASTGWPPAPAAGAVVLLPGAKRLAVRAYSGGFWSEPAPGPAVQPLARATGLEIAIEDSDGARYVRVLAL
jgi:prepilin-type N-terminal cleavage/methylation domain-containing protein